MKKISMLVGGQYSRLGVYVAIGGTAFAVQALLLALGLTWLVIH